MHLLARLLSASHPRTRSALDTLWANLPEDPKICWYPSAGSCFRDLLIWNHYPALADVPEPDLYIHTDYARPGRVPHDHADGRTRVTLQMRDRLELSPEITYQVDPGYASLAGAAGDRAIVELLHVHAESNTVGVIDKPVLYFHFENFNWFEEFALKRGLPISHVFKLREGCGMGGARASVSNLYPFLARVGCRHLVADQEVHINERVMERYLESYAADGSKPFTMKRKGSIGRLSGMNVEAFEVHPGCSDATWFDRALRTITTGSPWRTGGRRSKHNKSCQKYRQSVSTR
ncbi:MAG: hypothetical protein U5L08_07620 [Xanthomonadales bacterium]|nr:hypothetical protein [Xanthomonadales bacterium]